MDLSQRALQRRQEAASRGTRERKLGSYVKDNARMPANVHELDNYTANPTSSLDRRFKSRQKYIDKMKKVIQRGMTVEQMVKYQMQPSMDVNQSAVGSGLVYDTRPANGPVIDSKLKRVQDGVASQMFAHPETDLLAYHRRIEHPNSYRHAPVFGF